MGGEVASQGAEQFVVNTNVAKTTEQPDHTQAESFADKGRHLFTRVKKWGGRATIFMSAAALATACSSSPSSPAQETYHGGSTATYSAPEIPGQPQTYSVAETFASLAKDPNLPKDGGTIDISPIAKQFKSADYVSVVSTPPGHPEMEDVIDTGSAPVMEIRYDQAKHEFTYVEQTPKKLTNQELYQLLLPVMQNKTILTAAFENKKVTRIAMRLEAPPLPNSGPADYSSEQYVQEDWSSPKEGVQRTVFLFLPGVGSIDTQEERDVMRHETIHGLTGNDTLSESLGAPATPNPTELAKWNAACIDMRDFSLADAQRYKQASIATMETLSRDLNNQGATEVLNEIIQAMQNGTFDKLQPQQGENPNEAFSGKVPDCTTIGPWGVFVRLMNDRGLSSIVDHVFSSSNEAAGNAAATLHDSYQSMMEFQTIYSVLREGTYEQDSPEKLLGHEMDDWDELVTSTSDVSIAYPEQVAKSIKALPPDRRKVVLALVNLALTALNAQIPMQNNPEFHALVEQRLNTINRIAG